jgi:hypothetical protein
VLASVHALFYLQRRVIRNWLRRSSRSLIVWLLVLGVAFFSISGALFAGDSRPPEENGDGGIPGIYFEASAVLLFISTLIFAIWRGTGPPPRATAADVVFVLSSPIRSRVQFAYLMFREVGAMLSIITIVAGMSLIGPLIRVVTTSEATLEGAFGSPTIGIWLIILIGGVTRLAVWVATEQVVVIDARKGYRLRLGIRGLMALTALGVLAFVALPVARGEHEGFRAIADHGVERLLLLSQVPPLSFPPMIYSDDGSTFLGLGALLLTGLVITGAGLFAAKDFVEPIAVMAERQTDARGQSIDSGNDIQWSTMSQVGSAPRLRFSIPAFGHGPWALFWASLVRWARYQMAVAWVSVLTLLGLGVTVAVLVRMDIISHYWIWILVLSMPLFSSYSMFLDELRKPFLFMMPGPAWKRLVAAGGTSVLDGLAGSLALIIIVIATQARPVAEALALLLVALVVGFLIQATVGMVQVVLPSWLNRKIRTTLTFSLNVITILPALTAFILGLALSGEFTGFIAGVTVALITATIVLLVSVLLFDRLEMPV